LIFVYAVLGDEVFLTKRRVVLEAKEIWVPPFSLRAESMSRNKASGSAGRSISKDCAMQSGASPRSSKPEELRPKVWDINVEFRAAQIAKAAPLGE
jgi:hypothetical protein